MTDLIPLFPAVRLAVELTRRVRQLTQSPSFKSMNDPVTIADYGAQAVLLRALGHLHPSARVIAEERGEQYLNLVDEDARQVIQNLLTELLGERVTERDVVRWLDFGRDGIGNTVWTVDPIDGTRGFVAGRRYSVAVGVLEGGRPAAGLLACPAYPTAPGGMLFYTVDGKTYGEPLPGGDAMRFKVRSTALPASFHPVESKDNVEYDHAFLVRVYDALQIRANHIEQLDGQDKYATVAAGDADFYVRPARPHDRLHYIWDHVPGAALVQGAGGIVTDLTGAALDFSHGERLPRLGVIAASPMAHPIVLEAVQAVMAAEA